MKGASDYGLSWKENRVQTKLGPSQTPLVRSDQSRTTTFTEVLDRELWALGSRGGPPTVGEPLVRHAFWAHPAGTTQGLLGNRCESYDGVL